MCGGTAGLFIKGITRPNQSAGDYWRKMLDPRSPFEGFASAEHELQKEEDDKAALEAASSEEDISKTDSYAFDNTGVGVGDPKKRTKKHGLRQNILTSGQGLL